MPAPKLPPRSLPSKPAVILKKPPTRSPTAKVPPVGSALPSTKRAPRKRKPPVKPIIRVGLFPGQKVIRLTPSTTGRQIFPNLLGVIGGLNPALYKNPSSWSPYEFIPIQWSCPGQLWSSLPGDDDGYSWDYYPRPNQEPESTEEDE